MTVPPEPGLSSPVTPARRTLLARVIDYAGLYPPAALPLTAAVAEFTALRADPASWMLARFVSPARRIGELASLWGAGDGAPLAVAAIGSSGTDAAALDASTREDVAAVLDARGRHAGVVVDQFEVRLTADVLAAAAPAAVHEIVAGLSAAVAPLARPALLLAIEAPVAGADPAHVAAVVAGIAQHNRRTHDPGALPVAFKLRCGGLAAAAVPTPAEVAAALASCRRHGVAIKATQGLHHPFRRHDAALGARTHGFVNLLAATALARAQDLDEATIAAILDDDDPHHFDATGDALVWQGRRASVLDLAACRRHALMSFGSCSFAEPRDDLAALGWL